MSRARNSARSAFIRDALEAEIQRQQIREDEIRLMMEEVAAAAHAGARNVISRERVEARMVMQVSLCGYIRLPPVTGTTSPVMYEAPAQRYTITSA